MDSSLMSRLGNKVQTRMKDHHCIINILTIHVLRYCIMTSIHIKRICDSQVLFQSKYVDPNDIVREWSPAKGWSAANSRVRPRCGSKLEAIAFWDNCGTIDVAATNLISTLRFLSVSVGGLNI